MLGRGHRELHRGRLLCTRAAHAPPTILGSAAKVQIMESSSLMVTRCMRSDSKQERNKRRRGTIRNKTKEKLRQTYVILKELEDKKVELAQTRCQLASTRKRALELTK